MPMKNGKEIERKWVIPFSCIPERLLKDARSRAITIEQGYIDIGGKNELRVRRMNDRYYMTIKSDGDIERDEWEEEIPKWAFEAVWEGTAGRRFKKIRYTLFHEGYTLTIDVFDLEIPGFEFVIMECEFPNVGKAMSFIMPDWAGVSGVEVTDDFRFKGKNIALNPRAVRDAL